MKGEQKLETSFCLSSFTLHTSCLLACVFGLLAPSVARADEYSQVTHHQAELYWRGTLYVETRIGDVKVEGWEKSGVEIDVEKVVQAGSEVGARRLFDRIKIRLTENGEDVYFRTLYPSRRPWRMFRGATKLSANLRIRMPYEAKLVLKCVDGDVRVRGVVGNQQIRVSYGDVEVSVPSIDRLHSLAARAFLGYVQSDLHGEDSAGWGRRISFRNDGGDQDIEIRVGMGGVYVYGRER